MTRTVRTTSPLENHAKRAGNPELVIIKQLASFTSGALFLRNPNPISLEALWAPNGATKCRCFTLT